MARRRFTPPVQTNELRRLEPKSGFGLDAVRAGEAGHTRVFVDGHAERIDPLAQRRVCAHFVHDFANARQQPVVVQLGLARGDAVLRQLPRVAHEPRGECQRPHRHGSVVGGHAAKLRGGHERRARPQLRGSDGGDRSRRPRADYDDVETHDHGAERIHAQPTITAISEARLISRRCVRGAPAPGRPATQPTSEANAPIAATLPTPNKSR